MTRKAELLKVNNLGVILEMLQTSKDKSSEILLWRLTQDAKLVVSAKVDIVRKSRQELVVSIQEGQESLVQEIVGSRESVDFYIPESGLLLRCIVKTIEHFKKLVLQIPSSAALLERRKFSRLNVYQTEEISLSFSKACDGPRPISQSFNKSCFDISCGGFSFFISRLETKFFQIHDPIRNVAIILNGHTIKVSAEITLIKEANPENVSGLTYKAWRICCKFSQIDDISRKYLERFIFERLKEEEHVINY